jgi:hypothetical protein
MKVVEPSVSTDSRRRTRAPRAAILCAPIASESVTVGSRPSGTKATVTPSAKRKPSASWIPTSSAMTKNTEPTATDTNAMTRTTRSNSSASGLGGRRPAAVIWAIRASRVEFPVAVTTPRASPSTANVPAKMVSPGCGVVGTLSPVSVDVSMDSPSTLAKHISAEMRSPALRTTTSSGTSSIASMLWRFRSRITVTRRGSKSRSRSPAFSARYSWKNANRPLTTMTTKIANPSCGMPARIAKPPATHGMTAKKWTS